MSLSSSAISYQEYKEVENCDQSWKTKRKSSFETLISRLSVLTGENIPCKAVFWLNKKISLKYWRVLWTMAILHHWYAENLWKCLRIVRPPSLLGRPDFPKIPKRGIGNFLTNRGDLQKGGSDYKRWFCILVTKIIKNHLKHFKTIMDCQRCLLSNVIMRLPKQSLFFMGLGLRECDYEIR